MCNEYFSIGEWRIGGGLEESLDALVDAQEDEDGRRYSGSVDSVFGEGIPATFEFSQDRLESVELVLYEGASSEDAVSTLQAVFAHFATEFGGANFEGLSTTEGLTDEVAAAVVNQITAQASTGVASTVEETGELIYFSMHLSFSTEQLAEGNYLYGQFRYDSEAESYAVMLWEDQEFPASRVPEAMIMLRAPTE